MRLEIKCLFVFQFHGVFLASSVLRELIFVRSSYDEYALQRYGNNPTK